MILHDEFMAQDRGALRALPANRHGEAAARACRCSALAGLFSAAQRPAAAAASPRLLLTAQLLPLAGASLPIPQPVRSRRGRPEKKKKKKRVHSGHKHAQQGDGTSLGRGRPYEPTAPPGDRRLSALAWGE